MTVNGTEYTRDVEPRMLLIHFIRDELELTGSHWGCDTSNCGACVLWLEGAPSESRPAPGRQGPRPGRAHGRGPGTPGPPGPGPAGLHRLPRAPVRVLHAGHDDDRPLAAGPLARPRRGRDPRGHLGPDLPLHRLREHRPVRPLGRRAPGREPVMTASPEQTSPEQT